MAVWAAPILFQWIQIGKSGRDDRAAGKVAVAPQIDDPPAARHASRCDLRARSKHEGRRLRISGRRGFERAAEAH